MLLCVGDEQGNKAKRICPASRKDNLAASSACSRRYPDILARRNNCSARQAGDIYLRHLAPTGLRFPLYPPVHRITPQSNEGPIRSYSKCSPAFSHSRYRPWPELVKRCAAPDAAIQTWSVRAGDALLNHPKTIHASLPRAARLPGRRMAFTTRWIGSGVMWAPDAFSVIIHQLSQHLQIAVGAPPPEASSRSSGGALRADDQPDTMTASPT